jgi:hypothetical protein
MRFSFLTLVLFAVPVHADDPPYLAAAKERQQKAKAFEVTLSVKKEWRNIKPLGKDERRDFVGTGTAKLVVDGEKYWYSMDFPSMNGAKDQLTRHPHERAFDGTQVFSRYDWMLVKGPRAGEFDTQCRVGTPHEPPVEWASEFEPLSWAFRGTALGSLFAERADIFFQQNGYHQTILPTGRDEMIDGRRCIEIERVKSGRTTRRSDPTGWTPKRGMCRSEWIELRSSTPRWIERW